MSKRPKKPGSPKKSGSPKKPGKRTKASTKRTKTRRKSSSRSEKDGFRKQLDRSTIALPLLERMSGRARQPVVIDLNFNHFLGLSGAKRQVLLALTRILAGAKATEKPDGNEREQTEEQLLDALPSSVDKFKTKLCTQYVFAELTPSQIRRLVDADDRSAKRELKALKSELTQQLIAGEKEDALERVNQYEEVDAMRPRAHDVPEDSPHPAPPPLYRCRALYKIWPDFDAEPLLKQTLSTVKADAARISFSASGQEIVWAVIDSGIDSTHPHFQAHRNLDLPRPLRHADFTRTDGGSPFIDVPRDDLGHGTHVAGIVAGEIDMPHGEAGHKAASRVRDEQGQEGYRTWRIHQISGVAPECKLLSLKVLDDRGRGNRRASNILAALAYVNELNEHGRRIRVHGVNLSVGYEFEADWFGCGQSPLCIEVDRLVRSGVVVVAAAGNTGFGAIAPDARGPNMAGLALTINDPGNAQLALTVGSTHRYMPQQYGISYFSSKGPTGDGRLKPDLVAPGENVLSCAAGRQRDEVDRALARIDRRKITDLLDDERSYYREESGTSMAAPHVSGAIAAFLSIRPGYIGRPEEVKRIFLESATDLGRERYFQGHGLVDLMRAIQSV